MMLEIEGANCGALGSFHEASRRPIGTSCPPRWGVRTYRDGGRASNDAASWVPSDRVGSLTPVNVRPNDTAPLAVRSPWAR